MRKKLFFTKIYLNRIRDLSSWDLKFKHLKAHNLCDKGAFFPYFLATSMTNWVQIFSGLLFYTYVEIHQMRRLVFDNYQRCPVPSRMKRVSAGQCKLCTRATCCYSQRSDKQPFIMINGQIISLLEYGCW